MDGDDNIEAALPPRSSAPQRWTASVAESRFYWYDLLVNDHLTGCFRYDQVKALGGAHAHG